MKYLDLHFIFSSDFASFSTKIYFYLETVSMAPIEQNESTLFFRAEKILCVIINNEMFIHLFISTENRIPRVDVR